MRSNSARIVSALRSVDASPSLDWLITNDLEVQCPGLNKFKTGPVLAPLSYKTNKWMLTFHLLMAKRPLFHRTCRLPGQFVAYIQSIRWRRCRAVRRMFPSLCAFILFIAFILFVFAYPSGQNDHNFLSSLPVEKSGVRLLCDSKDLQY